MKRRWLGALALVGMVVAGCIEDITDVEPPTPVDTKTLVTGVTTKLFIAPVEVRAREALGVVLLIENTRSTAADLVASADPIASIQTTLSGQEITLVGGDNVNLPFETSTRLEVGGSHVQRWELVALRSDGAAATPGTYQVIVRLRVTSVDGAAVAPLELRGTFTIR